MADEKNTEKIELTAEDEAIINQIVAEESEEKINDIIDYIDSGELDRDIAKKKEEQSKEV